MIGRSGRAARWTVFLATAAWALVALVGLDSVVPASQAAPSKPPACSLQISAVANRDGTQVVSGTLTAGDSSPVSGAAITVTLAGQASGATTEDDGSFSAEFTIHQPGDYTVTVTTPATPRCGTPVEAKKPLTVALTVDLQVDALTVQAQAGGGVTVSGRLVSQGQGLAGSIVDLTPSWDAQGSATAMTGGDGAFIATLTAPGQASQSSLSVQVSFPGDGYYPAAQVTVAVQVVAAVASPTPAAPSASPSAAASATATAGSQQTTGAASPWRTGSHLFIVLIVFVVVAALATGTFLIVAVVSRQRRGLAVDERRGFGSDFGAVEDSGHAGDVGLAGLGLGEALPTDGLDGAR